MDVGWDNDAGNCPPIPINRRRTLEWVSALPLGLLNGTVASLIDSLTLPFEEIYVA